MSALKDDITTSWNLKCTCNFVKYHGIPCRHILFAAEKAGIKVRNEFQPLCHEKHHYSKYKKNIENALSPDFISSIPCRWSPGKYELNLQKLIDG